MKEQAIEFAKDFGTGAAIVAGTIIVLGAFSYFTGFNKTADFAATIFGYGVFSSGAFFIGKKVRYHFSPNRPLPPKKEE